MEGENQNPMPAEGTPEVAPTEGTTPAEETAVPAEGEAPAEGSM